MQDMNVFKSVPMSDEGLVLLAEDKSCFWFVQKQF